MFMLLLINAQVFEGDVISAASHNIKPAVNAANTPNTMVTCRQGDGIQ